MIEAMVAAVAGGALGASAVLRSKKRRERDARRSVGPREAREAEHARKVARIAKQLKERTSTAPLSLKKRAPAHQVPKLRDLRRTDEKVDLSDLNAIIAIDPDARTCTAEPGVTYVDLVAATLPHGLVPIVVPELKTITIGGAVAGCSIESMSFRYGGFHDTCLEYEVITAKGEVLVCTPDNENALVFQMIHGSFGTLGILSRLVFRLTPAKPYVRVTYEKHRTLASYKASIWRHFETGDVDFMDGIIHGPDEYVLSLGHFADEAPYTSRYDWMRIYYLSTRERTEDYLETPDYFFRYDRGVTNVRPRSWLGRLLLGRFLSSTEILAIAERMPFLLPKNPSITLDVFVPFSKIDDFLGWYGEAFGFFPLWCVPYRRVRDYEWIADGFFDGIDDPLLVDLAIYGMKQEDGKPYHRMMEEKLYEVRGIKTLIDHNEYPEGEFWKTWNKRTYDEVKARTDPDNVFRGLYEKTCRAVMGRT